jgi:hypothetical protein
MNPIHAIRLAIAGLVSIGVLAQFPAPNASYEASETILEVPASVPPTIPAPPRTGPEPAPLEDVLQATVSSCDDALRLALHVGWPPELLAHLGRIMFRESACKEWAWNPHDTAGGSRGLLQINGAHTRRTPWAPGGWLQSQHIGIRNESDLFNAELNLRAGLVLYRYAERVYGDGWQPWAATRDRD